MKEKLNKRDEKQVLNAIEGARQARRRLEEKEDAKRWAEFELPLTLAEHLAGLTKHDLSAIRSHLSIPGASTLNKKDLIAVLETKVPASIEALFYKLDESRYRLLKQIADRGGQGSPNGQVNRQLDYWKSRGLLFTGTYKGKKTLAMPPEIVASFKRVDSPALREAVRRNTEWIKLLQGLLFYYGVLDLSDLEKLIRPHLGGAELRLGELYHVLAEAEPYCEGIRIRAEGFSHTDVFSSEKVYAEQQSRESLPFYPVSKAQLLAASEPGYVDRSPAFETFAEFIRTTYALPREEAEDVVAGCVYNIRNGRLPSDLLEMLQYQLEMDTMELIQFFMHHIMQLHNTTRQWYLKGYFPNELSALKSKKAEPAAPTGEVIDFATGRKVGRNDPCPCGSGKKYKKCCGN